MNPEAPTGVVSFLFSDVEGSTRLAQLHPQSVPDALAVQHNLIRQAVEMHSGFIFKSVGDSVCCAFSSPADAVKAAVDAQKAITSASWKDAVIKVRMGIHCGEAAWNGSDYTGYVTLARTQRIMSSASGEQIVTSGIVYSEAADLLPSSVSFRELGERRLKDLNQPVRLYQVCAEGLKEEFPPLNTLDARPNNLPFQLSRFVGREKEKEDIKDLLKTHPLLTLFGAGGTGKTRLALQAAAEIIDEFEGGIWFVELATVSEPEYVVPEIMSSLGLSSDGKSAPSDILKNYLREKEILIILDNCEHLINETAGIAQQLLSSCPKLKILASSREALKIGGERTYHLPSMSLPDVRKNYDSESLSQFESVQLFIDRSLSVNPKFEVSNENAPAVAQLCNDLDGIPLAIELAAARMNVLSVEKILERLSDRFKLLTGGKRTSLPRQQTLKALIDWSYGLLSDYEKLLFARLSVFQGGWKLEAAEAICSAEPVDEIEVLDLMSNLIDKSLIKSSDSESEMRYSMLETIRQYSKSALAASPEEKETMRRHFGYFSGLVSDSEEKLTGRRQRECLHMIDADYENIREALKWAIEECPAEGLKMAISLGKYWELRGNFSEGCTYLEKALSCNDEAEPLIRARALYLAGFFLTYLASHHEAEMYLQDAMKIFRDLGEREGEVLCLVMLGNVKLVDGKLEVMEELTREGLKTARQLGNKLLTALCLRYLAAGRMYQGNYQESAEMAEECLAIYRESGDEIQIAKIINNIGAIEYLAANYDKAIETWEECLRLRRGLGDRHGIAMSLTNLGSAFSMIKDYDTAEKLLYQSIEMFRELGDRRIYVNPLNTLGLIANDRGEYLRALGIYGESITIASEIGEKYYLMKAIEGLSNSYIGLKEYETGCIFSALYISQMTNLNINVTKQELTRIEEIKDELRLALEKSEYDRLWEEGRRLTIEEAVQLMNSDYRTASHEKRT
ncbi:MAG: tetratricopeptide repeat protein [Ignavibacteria bacterium]|nr:tetratricopeptide repeat protein [Ignavibacteria bacterium]